MNYDDDAPFEVARYREMQKALPGAGALYRLTRAYLETSLPEGAHVFVVGAGGGREIENIAASDRQFLITGVDPSKDMLNIARWFADASGRPESVTLVEGVASDVEAPSAGFDAATSLLVMHFLPDDQSAGGKLSYLRTIRERVRTGGLLIHADVSVEEEVGVKAFEAAFLQHARLAGLGPEDASRGPDIIGAMPIVSAARTETLLSEAGFSNPTLFFQALWYRAWVARAR